jgi:hypothetical protein
VASKTKEGVASAAPSLDKLVKLIHDEIKAMRAEEGQADQTALGRAIRAGELLRQARAHFPARNGGWYQWLAETLPGCPKSTVARWIQLAAPENLSRTRGCTSITEALREISTPRKPEDATVKPQRSKPTPAGKRMRAARMARADAKRNGRPVAFWEIGWEVSKMVYGLASWKVEDVPLDYDNMNAMATVEEDLLYLYDWMDETLSLIHSRMGEHGMRQQLRKLQARTVKNGCTPEEAANAARAAGRLQRKIDNVLEAAS